MASFTAYFFRSCHRIGRHSQICRVTVEQTNVPPTPSCWRRSGVEFFICKQAIPWNRWLARRAAQPPVLAEERRPHMLASLRPFSGGQSAARPRRQSDESTVTSRARCARSVRM